MTEAIFVSPDRFGKYVPRFAFWCLEKIERSSLISFHLFSCSGRLNSEKSAKRFFGWMRDIFWGGVQPTILRGGVQTTTITTTATTATSWSQWHGGGGKLNFQPYCKGCSLTGEKGTHSINVARQIAKICLEMCLGTVVNTSCSKFYNRQGGYLTDNLFPSPLEASACIHKPHPNPKHPTDIRPPSPFQRWRADTIKEIHQKHNQTTSTNTQNWH